MDSYKKYYLDQLEKAKNMSKKQKVIVIGAPNFMERYRDSLLLTLKTKNVIIIQDKKETPDNNMRVTFKNGVIIKDGEIR